MQDEKGRFQVAFRGEALEDWRRMFPSLPPGDEVVLWMKRAPCNVCQKEDFEFGAIDPEYIDEEGELVGTHICIECVKEGH